MWCNFVGNHGKNCGGSNSCLHGVMDCNIVFMLCNYISLSNTLQMAYITVIYHTQSK